MLPVHRPPAMLPLAIESVLAQTLTDFDLVVICDGAPPETAACARDYAARDPRVRVLDLPKGERHGEAHRHRVLQEAVESERPLVAQLADDDLWFPEHLAELERLLADVDFGNLLQARLTPDGAVALHHGDLADPQARERMRTEPFNFFGPSVAGYRLAAYRRLVHGWEPAPTDVWSDLHMWRAFLDTPGLRLATRFSVQGVSLSAAERTDADLAERAAESRRVAAGLLGSAGARDDFRQRAFADLWAHLDTAVTHRDQLSEAHDRAVAAIADLTTQLEATHAAFVQAGEEAGRQRQASLRRRARIRRLRAQVAGLRRRNTALAEELATIRASRSWRLSAPLRRLTGRRDR